MVMDHFTDRLGLESILSVNVDGDGTETVRVNGPFISH